jgi:hypothetical protein
VHQQLQPGSSPIDEQEHGAAHGILSEPGPAQTGQAVNSVSEVDRLNMQKDPHAR